jgi:hypothetical protein
MKEHRIFCFLPSSKQYIYKVLEKAGPNLVLVIFMVPFPCFENPFSCAIGAMPKNGQNESMSMVI